MAALRSSAKTAKLANALTHLRTGPSARQLPSLVSGLSVVCEGVKGNAGARKFAQTVLPSLSYANPTVPIKVEKPTKADEPWTQEPGVAVTFNDHSLSPAFFPLNQQKHDKLVTKFWSVFGEERTLRAFAEGKEVESSSAPAATEGAAEQQQEPAAAAEGAAEPTVAA
ncbi:hypothetical protein JCM8547_004735 [Rhodosporidiobolus lusitaniae]